MSTERPVPGGEPGGLAEARAAVAAIWDELSAATVALDAQERAWRSASDREQAAREALETLERKRSDALLSRTMMPGDPWPELDEDIERAERRHRAVELTARERERELAAATERHLHAEAALAHAEAALAEYGPAPEGELAWSSTRESRRRRRRRVLRRRPQSATGTHHAPAHHTTPHQGRRRRRFALPVGAGALATMCSRLIGKGLSFGFIVILVREVSQTDFASYSYLVALALTFSLLSDSGVSVIAGRDVARGDLGLAAAYRGGLTTVMGAGVLGALAVAAFGAVASGPGIPPLALVFTAAFVLVANVGNFQCDLLRGAGRLGLEGALQIVGGVLFVVTGTVIVVSGLGLVALMAAFTLKELVMLCIVQLALPSPRSAPPMPGLGRSLLRVGILMSIATTCLAILARTSLIVLSNVASARETAHYAAAFRFGEIALMVCHTLGLGLLPYMSKRYAVDRTEGARLALRLTAVCVGAALLVTPLLVLVTPTVVTFVFGSEYAGATVPAEILVGMLPILMLLILTWNALLADRRERPVLVAAIAGVVAAGGSALWIVHQGTGRAAAFSAVASFAAVALVCTWSLFRASAGGKRSAPPQLSTHAEATDDVLV